MQLHNGPLRSCRKIGGNAAVQKSHSKRARRNPSPKMIKVTVHELNTVLAYAKATVRYMHTLLGIAYITYHISLGDKIHPPAI